jgi:hypothetical protein
MLQCNLEWTSILSYNPENDVPFRDYPNWNSFMTAGIITSNYNTAAVLFIQSFCAISHKSIFIQVHKSSISYIFDCSMSAQRFFYNQSDTNLMLNIVAIYHLIYAVFR